MHEPIEPPAPDSQAQAQAVVRFSRRVQQLIDTGAGDWATALQQILAADTPGQADWDLVAKINGLPRGYFQNNYWLRNRLSIKPGEN